jgi:hypothetical protein
MTRMRVLINGFPHYDKGVDWYIKNAREYVDERPASIVSLEEESPSRAGEWTETAEVHGETYYS